MLTKTALTAAALSLLAAIPAAASSDGAWQQMRADIRAKCLAQHKKAGSAGKTAIEVNPFGSERFGAAILTTRLKAGGTERTVCIYDKAVRTAELTAPFGN